MDNFKNHFNPSQTLLEHESLHVGKLVEIKWAKIYSSEEREIRVYWDVGGLLIAQKFKVEAAGLKGQKAVRAFLELDAFDLGDIAKLKRSPTQAELQCLIGFEGKLLVGVWDVDGKQGNYIIVVKGEASTEADQAQDDGIPF